MREEHGPYIKLVLLPFASVLQSVAVVVIQPQCSNPMSFVIQPFALILVFVEVDSSTSACTKWLQVCCGEWCWNSSELQVVTCLPACCAANRHNTFRPTGGIVWPWDPTSRSVWAYAGVSQVSRAVQMSTGTAPVPPYKSTCMLCRAACCRVLPE